MAEDLDLEVALGRMTLGERDAFERGRKHALRHLGSAMKKILDPASLASLITALTPEPSFLDQWDQAHRARAIDDPTEPPAKVPHFVPASTAVEARIGALKLGPKDVVVVSAAHKLSVDEQAALVDAVRKACPDHPVLVLDGAMHGCAFSALSARPDVSGMFPASSPHRGGIIDTGKDDEWR